MLSDAWKTPAGWTLGIIIHVLRFMRCLASIHDPGHALPITGTYAFIMPIITAKATHTLSSTGTSALALVVSGQSIAASETSIAFRTYVGPLSRVKFGMSLQVMKPAKARIAAIAVVRLLLTVRQ